MGCAPSQPADDVVIPGVMNSTTHHFSTSNRFLTAQETRQLTKEDLETVGESDDASKTPLEQVSFDSCLSRWATTGCKIRFVTVWQAWERADKNGDGSLSKARNAPFA